MFPNQTNSKAGKATPAKEEKPTTFFQQFVALPPAFQGGPFQIVGVPASGISMRDYFAAQAIACCRSDEMTCLATAEWSYMLADRMLEIRSREKKSDDSETSNGSQFHGDYLKK